MKRGLIALLALLGCSNISGTSGSAVALEIRLPTPAVIEQFDTLTLVARALDADGREVNVPIVWATPDSTISVESSGRATADTNTGSGRVQARTGMLNQGLVPLEIHRRSDTLAITGPTTLTVLASDSASDSLVAAVQSLAPDTAGISNTRILYEVVDTAAARGTVRFAGGGLALRAATGATGTPITAVTLRRVPGATPPASVVVRVSATRPSGVAVPGSGRSFTVNFQ